MKLYIAEKPSLGRAIADVLPKPHKKENGYIRVGNGDCVSWCIGHLLEQAEPHQYDPAFKSWSFDTLPILPNPWKWQVKPKTRSQYTVLKNLIKQADHLVHAGDPDREGQLLVDEVLQHLKVPAGKMASAERLLISDLNPSAVRKALQQQRGNREFIPLSTSALARARADWLYGINLTRALTLQGRKVGYDGVLSVGRVQTPVLGLVVRRDREIEAFVPKPFYPVLAHCQAGPDDPSMAFSAKWIPSEACQPWQDEEGRVLHRPLAENVARRITGQPATVESYEDKPKKIPAPLPYSLSALQIDASKAFSMSAQQVLDTCQKLYETHKLITYPRSDCRYLPTGHFSQAGEVSGAISSNCQKLSPLPSELNLSQRGRCWNDSKVEAHHAIIPTARKMDLAKLGKAEAQLYELIARQYLMQFMPACEQTSQKARLEIAGGQFEASVTTERDPGWKALMMSQRKADKLDPLPKLKAGQVLFCREGEVLEKQTEPPKAYTDATLLAAMTGIARFVRDAELKKILRDTDGIGTEATRASIIELLFKRGFFVRQGKQIRSTDAGKALIDSLPESLTLPDMTAQWEQQLDRIAQQQARYQDFMGLLEQQLHQLIDQTGQTLPEALRGVKAQGKRRKSFGRRKSAGQNRRKKSA